MPVSYERHGEAAVVTFDNPPLNVFGQAMRAGLQAAIARARTERPVRLILPYPPGGSTDAVARHITQQLAIEWKQPVIVDNRPGAGGVTGVDVAAKALPDGYTIVLGSAGGVAISPQLDRGTPYHPLRDLTPLTLGVLVPEPIVVSSATPYRSLQELIAAARAQPGKINQGSTGSGSLPHLAGELLKK